MVLGRRKPFNKADSSNYFNAIVMPVCGRYGGRSAVLCVRTELLVLKDLVLYHALCIIFTATASTMSGLFVAFIIIVLYLYFHRRAHLDHGYFIL